MIEIISNLESELTHVMTKLMRIHSIKQDIGNIFVEVYKEVYRIYCNFVKALSLLNLPKCYKVEFSDVDEEIIIFSLYSSYNFEFRKLICDSITISFKPISSIILEISLHCKYYGYKEIKFAVNKIDKYNHFDLGYFEDMLNSLIIIVQLDKYIEKTVEKYEEVKRRWIRMLEVLRKVNIITTVSENERVKALKEELSI